MSVVCVICSLYIVFINNILNPDVLEAKTLVYNNNRSNKYRSNKCLSKQLRSISFEPKHISWKSVTCRALKHADK